MQKLTGDLVQKYTEDFKFQAYSPQRDGVYTQFTFMDADVFEYADFVNEFPLEAISFVYQFQGFDVDLNIFSDIKSIRSLGVNLNTPVKFHIQPEVWNSIRFRYLALLGNFDPGLNFIGKLSSLSDGFLVDYGVYSKIYPTLTSAPVIEVQNAPKEWLGEELGGFSALRKLKLNSCGMSKLPKSLEDSPAEIVILAGCKALSNVDVLKRMRNLKYIQIYSCPRIKDYSFLREMQNIRAIDVSKPIEDFNLKDLPALDFYQVHAAKGDEYSFVRNDGEKLRHVGSKPLDELLALGVLTGD